MAEQKNSRFTGSRRRRPAQLQGQGICRQWSASFAGTGLLFDPRTSCVGIGPEPPAVLRNFNSILNHGRLAGTGFVSILPVDQGIEHSAGASFAANPLYFDPENIVKLAIEGGCNAVASTLGVLGAVSRKYAHKIPFLVKLNHNEFLRVTPTSTTSDYLRLGQAGLLSMGAVGVGATIYFGSEESSRQIQEVSRGCSRRCRMRWEW